MFWGNIPIPLSPEFRFNRIMAVSKETRDRYKGTGEIRHDSASRAVIPYPIARFIADTVKNLV